MKTMYVEIIFRLCCLFLTVASLSGCVAGSGIVAFGEVGLAYAQERTVGNAINDKILSLKVRAKVLEVSDAIFDDSIIRVLEGNVYVFGRVSTKKDKIALINIVKNTEGVLDIYEDVFVSPKSDQGFLSDLSIKFEITQKITFDKHIDSINYDVVVVRGNVYFIGIAQDDEEHMRVTNIARGIKNVNRVISYIIHKDERKQHV